jgi:hypothetical protein
VTLPEFFERLMIKVNAELLSAAGPGPTSANLAMIINQHLETLRMIALMPKDMQALNHSMVKSSWAVVLDKTKGIDLFSEFRGNAELRKELELFLKA